MPVIGGRPIRGRRLILDRRGSAGGLNAGSRDPLEPRITHPVMTRCIEVPMRGRGNLVAVRSDLLETPVAFPAISRSDDSGMGWRRRQHTKALGAAIAGAAPPLPRENLEGTLINHPMSIQHTERPYLSETVVASPALLARAEMGISGDVVARHL